MRVLVVHPGPNYSVADVHNGLVAGLKANGCDVGVFNLDDRIEFYSRAHVRMDDGSFHKAFDDNDALMMAAKGIEAVCYEWWPDVVVVVSGFFIPPVIWGVLTNRPHHIVYYCTESPYEDDRQGQPSRYVDTVVLNDPTNLDQFRADVNPNTHYLAHSYDPNVHHPGKRRPSLACDFGFVGTAFPSRIDFFEAVDFAGVDVKLAGNWTGLDDGSPLHKFLHDEPDHCMSNLVTADMYRSSRISANLYRKEHSEQGHAQGWAIGPREVELAACGTFFLREPRAEGDVLFPMLPTFTESDEFSDLLRWWLNRPDQARDAAAKARAVIADRTFTNTAAQLLRIVDAAGARKRTPAEAA
jgi:spore maturation protein CgeB